MYIYYYVYIYLSIYIYICICTCSFKREGEPVPELHGVHPGEVEHHVEGAEPPDPL